MPKAPDWYPAGQVEVAGVLRVHWPPDTANPDGQWRATPGVSQGAKLLLRVHTGGWVDTQRAPRSVPDKQL